jgi:hypothetical protein
MALTMTRTRTQTALTRLATMVANLHGELAFVEGRLLVAQGPVRLGLEARRAQLLVDRDALYATLRQFDAELDPTVIGTADGWLKPYGRGRAGERRYEKLLPTLQEKHHCQ